MARGDSVNSELTVDEQQWLDIKADVKAGKHNAHRRFNNMAKNKAGDLLIGMTHNKNLNTYSSRYTQTNGVRDFGGSQKWDSRGRSMDGGSDLDMSSIQVGISTI